MTAYIVRRILFMIPTIFGIMLVSFVVVQFAPGGPVERVIAQLSGADTGATSRISGSASGDFSARGARAPAARQAEVNSKYRGAQGLDPAFIKSLEKQFGFDKPAYERFFIMLWNYVRFDFGKSYFRDVSVLHLIKEKLPVSISLGIWMTLLSYLISIPLGIRKAVRDGSQFDIWTSGVIIVGYAIPGFLFAILLIMLFAGGSFFQIFPLRGLVPTSWSQLPWWQKILDYFWHLMLPMISMGLAAFATMTLFTKNSFLEELRKQYVLTARAKGCSERQVLYGHIFRNAMLLVIAGFPAAFVSAFFAGSLLIETIFSLDGLGLLSFESVLNRDYPVVFANLYIFALRRPCRESDFRPHLYLDRSAHRFRDAGGVRWTSSSKPKKRSGSGRARSAGKSCGRTSSRPARWGLPLRRAALNFLRSTPGAGAISRPIGAVIWSLWLFLVLFVISLFAEFIANDRPLFIHFDGKTYFPVFVTYPDTEFGDTLGTAADYRDPYVQRFLDEHNATVIWAPIRFSYRTINDRPPSAFPSKPTWLLNQRDCDFAAQKRLHASAARWK